MYENVLSCTPDSLLTPLLYCKLIVVSKKKDSDDVESHLAFKYSYNRISWIGIDTLGHLVQVACLDLIPSEVKGILKGKVKERPHISSLPVQKFL